MTGPSTLTSAPLRLGTRRSTLAMAQAQQVARAVTNLSGREVELVEITTRGDLSRAAVVQLGSTGVWVSALRDALLDGKVDFAVHSLKDMPTAPADGLTLAAIPPREDPRDVLVARDGLTLAELPAGARVGTGAPRRAAQLRALGHHLDVVPMRGNVDTRIGRVTAGSVDAVVLARAGLARIDRLDVVTETLDLSTMLPAPGQGALAVEARSVDSADPADAALLTLLARLDDPHTRAVVTAERSLLTDLEADCRAPVGAWAEVIQGEHVPELRLRAVVVSIDGTRSLQLSATGGLDEAVRLGRHVAAELLVQGAADLMGERVP